MALHRTRRPRVFIGTVAACTLLASVVGSASSGHAWCGSSRGSAAWRGPLAQKRCVALAAASPWKVLGVQEGSERNEIKRRYRKLVLTEHPDKKPDDPNAAANFQRITEAYQDLMSENPAKYAPEQAGYGESVYGQASASEAQNFARNYGGQGFEEDPRTRGENWRAPPPPPRGYADDDLGGFGSAPINGQKKYTTFEVGPQTIVAVSLIAAFMFSTVYLMTNYDDILDNFSPEIPEETSLTSTATSTATEEVKEVKAIKAVSGGAALEEELQKQLLQLKNLETMPTPPVKVIAPLKGIPIQGSGNLGDLLQQKAVETALQNELNALRSLEKVEAPPAP